MDVRHQGIMWDRTEVKIQKMVTRDTSLLSLALLWGRDPGPNGPCTAPSAFTNFCGPHTVVFDCSQWLPATNDPSQPLPLLPATPPKRLNLRIDFE